MTRVWHRVPGWEAALIAWAVAEAGEPFAWGTRDCMSLGLRATEIIYGPEFSARVRRVLPKHESASSALRVLHRLGHVPQFLGRALGAHEVGHGYAHHGDLILLRDSADIIPWSCFVVVSNRLLGVHEAERVRWWHGVQEHLLVWGEDAYVMRLPNG